MNAYPETDAGVESTGCDPRYEVDDLFEELDAQDGPEPAVGTDPVAGASPWPAGLAGRAPTPPTVSLTELLNENLPADQPWTAHGLLPEVGCGFLSGPPKEKKTWLVLDATVAILSGQPFLRCDTQAADRSILYIGGEGRREVLRKRVVMLCRGRGVDPRSIGDRLHLAFFPPINMATEEGIAALADMLLQLSPPPAMLVIDPFSRFHNGDENSRGEIEPILTALRRLSERFQILVLIVHHSRKPSSTGGFDALRGSSAMDGWHDVLIWVGTAVGKGDTRRIHTRLRDAESVGPFHFRLEVDDGREEARIVLTDEDLTTDLPTARGQKVLAFLRNDGPATANAIKNHMGASGTTVTAILQTLLDDGQVALEVKGAKRLYRALESIEHEDDCEDDYEDEHNHEGEHDGPEDETEDE